jgi:hypothetical protein
MVIGTALIITLLVLFSRFGIGGASTPASLHASQTHRIVSGDISYMGSVKDLIRQSIVIFRGKPRGTPEFKSTTSTGDIGEYLQKIQVEHVLKGTIGSVVLIVRTGIRPTLMSDATVKNDDLPGPMPAGESIFFIQPSLLAGAWMIAGYSQGVLQLVDDRVVSVGQQGFESLGGLTESDLAALIQTLEG